MYKRQLIDVRSPSEYYKGHMPNSINIPLFDDDERSIIGTIYKKEGRKKAVIEGLKFFEKKWNYFLIIYSRVLILIKPFLIKIMKYLSGYIALEEECVHKVLDGY